MRAEPSSSLPRPDTRLKSVVLGLSELVGADYLESVCRARAAVTGESYERLAARAAERVDFLPDAHLRRCNSLLASVGLRIAPPFAASASGAGSASFVRASNIAAAPLAGFGFTRVGEDGRLYLVSKSEHYHAALGHAFPGYALIELARDLGISNVTHNNSRGHVTRTLERELVRAAAGIVKGDAVRLDAVISSTQAGVLNRVINLETGSLAVEAALKMMLARFYRLDASRDAPVYENRTPVLLVMGDDSGGIEANYHGTTILMQVLRGMWPKVRARMEEDGLFTVRPVGVNDIRSLRSAVEQFDRGRYKIAGFFHEIVLMNYGAVLLSPEFLQEAYEICRAHDIPVVVDEIQTCMWSPELFLFREYGLEPDFVSVGKGFPGGNASASRILVSAAMDNLNQFDALVTNGQEELSSLYYLATMAFVEANGDYIVDLGTYYHEGLETLARRYPERIARIEGLRHLSSIYFRSDRDVDRFVRLLTDACIDVSSQAYKLKSPPAALTKLPVIATPEMVDYLLGRMDAALRAL